MAGLQIGYLYAASRGKLLAAWMLFETPINIGFAVGTGLGAGVTGPILILIAVPIHVLYQRGRRDALVSWFAQGPRRKTCQYLLTTNLSADYSERSC